MRLITRRDTSLAVALIAGTLIAFGRPLHWLLELNADIGERFQIDLVPALTLLTVVFVFHIYGKRQQARAELHALSQEMAATRARTETLERLMSFGQALANAHDRQTFEQVLWRMMPQFIGHRECSILSRHKAGFEFLMRDAQMLERRAAETLEAMIVRAAGPKIADAVRQGIADREDVCFPLMAAETIVGAVIVRNDPALSASERTAVGAAGALIAVASRNLNLLHDARQSGARDPLTDCYTRAHTIEQLQRELRRSRRIGRPVSVIMFDLDGFKEVNDRHGHLEGDAVLASVGAQLSHILRSTDLRCRYGGDEFLLVLPDTPLLGAQQVAECVRREIGDRARDAEGKLRVTASLGVACSLPGEMDETSLIGRADEALYRAKRAGRNRCCISTGPVAADNKVTPIARATAAS